MSPNELNNSKLYRLEFNYYPEYLYAFVEGEKDNVEISLSFWKEVAEECRRKGYKKVLVEENLEENPSEAMMYEIGAKLPAILEGIIAAFVDRRIEHLEANLLGGVIFFNRGGKGKVFTDLEQARKWLLSEKKPTEEFGGELKEGIEEK
jgi:hypothetical protein